MRLPALFPLLGLALLSCDKDTSDSASDGWAPDNYCPGGEGCADNDGALQAGAAAISITPTCVESYRDCGEDGLCEGDEGWPGADSGEGDAYWEDDENEPFLDCGCDRLCPDDEGYPGADEGEGDGEFQVVWLAGFHNTRPAQGVHDDLWARAIVFDQGETRVAVVSLDLVGWFYSDVQRTREMLDPSLGIDLLMVTSTHQHEGPDTMGIWGETETKTGYQEEYAQLVREGTVQAVEQAVADLREVGAMKVGWVDGSTYHAEKGIRNLVRDSRDPVVIDSKVSGALLTDTSGETIAVLSHFGNHPEAMGDENALITSDYADPLRVSLEDGISYNSYSREGYGGTAVYIQGTVGGLMTPLGLDVTDGEGNEFPRDEGYTWERNEAMGKVKAEMTMDAIDGGDDVDLSSVKLSYGSQIFMLPVENWGFQAFFLAGLFNREVYDWNPEHPASDTNIPKVDTEMSYIRVGPLELLTVPGELFPELAIGGYDGAHLGSDQHELIDADNPNPPDLTQAPEGPYLKDRMGSEHAWIVGLGNDQVGYLIPPYDFVLDDVIPYIEQADGDHYEETNSLGILAVPEIEAQAQTLTEWVQANL